MRNFITLIAIGLFLLAANPVKAGDEPESTVDRKIVIALTTDDFELGETDISHLAVGDAETIVTDSGKTIDLLRTEDGVEIYVDGELLDLDDEALHEEKHVVKKRVEVICDDEDDCENMVWITDDADLDLDMLHEDGEHGVIMIHEGGHDLDIHTDEEHEKVIIIKNRADDSI
jgi:hypothetical protein